MKTLKFNRSTKFDVEKASPEMMREIQLDTLTETLNYVYSNSKFYREFYDKQGFHPDHVKSIEDMSKIPFVNREMLGEHSQDMVCAPRSAWVDICPTSGTSGNSIYFPMTKNDLVFLSLLCSRGAKGLGIDENDSVQVMLTSDALLQPSKIMTYMFQFHLGALVMRVGPIGTERQIRIMQELKPNILFGISTYLLSLGKSLAEHGFDPVKELDLKMLISTGSSIYHSRWSPTRVNEEIRRIWQAPYYSILGSTELNTGLWECQAHNGHHVHWDYMLPEIIDPNTEKTLPPGETGELVLTFGGREAMPLVRYRTGDITMIETDPCPCGRTSPRIMAVVGRRDQMMKIKGTLVFPLQIEEAVLSVPGVSAYLVEVIDDEMGQAQIVVTVSTEGDDEKILARTRETVKDQTLITPRMKTDSRERIEEIWYSEKRVKPRKFWDRRKK